MTRTELLLKELSNAFGPSGFEGPVREIMMRELIPLSDNVETDGLGSLIVRKDSSRKGPTIMLSAHMDEVGLMVKYITDDGYIKFQTLGGWIDQALINQRWKILTENGYIKGVSGIKTPHVMSADERNRLVKKNDVFIDIGALSKEDAELRMGIKPGDPIAPDSKFERLNDGALLLGKSWDDRVGLAVMVEVMKRLFESPASATIYAVATVQEEIGLRGAHTSSYKVAPDVGINLEAGVAADYPGISMDEAQEKLGFGPSIFLHDASMLPDLRFRDFVVDTARELDIPLQFNVLSGYGEDGAEIQKAHGGLPTINITVPARYLHSHNSLINIKDFELAVDLVTAVILRLDEKETSKISTFIR